MTFPNAPAAGVTFPGTPAVAKPYFRRLQGTSGTEGMLKCVMSCPEIGVPILNYKDLQNNRPDTS